MVQIKSFTFNILGTNCHILWDDAGKNCVIVDPGMYREFEQEELLSFLDSERLTPDSIFLTHGHFDHLWGVAFLERHFGCPVYMAEEDRITARMGTALLPSLECKKAVETFDFTPVQEGDSLDGGGIRWQVLSTPGHSKGSVCYYAPEEKLLLSGDSLFAGAIGRTDLPGGDYDVLMQSLLGKIMLLSGDVEVLPGHGPASSIAKEAMTNPFLLPFNAPDTSWWEQDGLSLRRT